MNKTVFIKEMLLGYQVENSSAQEFADLLFNDVFETFKVASASPKWLACLNPHSYVIAEEDQHFSIALKHADWLIPDGVGIVIASKILGGSIHERVTGSDLFSALNNRMNLNGGHRVFFLGATEETLAKIRVKMAADFPRVIVVGTYSPPFKAKYSAIELNDMIGAINLVKPDVLWVGMTAPKQEKWIYDNLHHLDVRFAAAIGAVFDFYAGNVNRSQLSFQRLGLEWLPRLIKQPRRLWRRMFVSAPIFLIIVLRVWWLRLRNNT